MPMGGTEPHVCGIHHGGLGRGHQEGELARGESTRYSTHGGEGGRQVHAT